MAFDPAVYWDFFNPSLLFFSGDSSLINSTRLTGVFVWPVGVFLLLGLYRIVTSERTWTNGLLVAAFVTGPLAAVLVAEVAIRRALLMLPFAVLIAIIGLRWMFSTRPHAWRAAAVVLLALVAFEFGSFRRDYFSDYRNRSGVWFGGNIRGGLEALVQRERERPSSTVYVSNRIPFVDAYWEFYAVKLGREDLLKRTIDDDPGAAETELAAEGGLVLTPMHEQETQRLVGARGWHLVSVIAEPNGTASFMVYEK